MDSLRAAISPAFSDGWLTAQTAANAGSGTVSQSPQDTDIPAPAVPTADPALPVDLPNVAPDSTGYVYEGGTWEPGGWGGFTRRGWVQGPAVVPEDDGGDAYANVLARQVGTVQQTLNSYAGYDAHSQATDDKGWEQNTPTGRTALRRLLGASSVGYRLQWPVTEQPAVPKRFAKTSTTSNTPGGVLPDFANLDRGGPGNIAYETPGPAETVSPAQAVTGRNKWGNWNA